MNKMITTHAVQGHEDGHREAEEGDVQVRLRPARRAVMKGSFKVT